MTPYPGYGPGEWHPPELGPDPNGGWHPPMPPNYTPVPPPEPNFTPGPAPAPNFTPGSVAPSPPVIHSESMAAPAPLHTEAAPMHTEAVPMSASEPMHTEAAPARPFVPEAVHPVDAPTVQHPLPVPEHLPGPPPQGGWTHAFTNSNVLNADGTSSTHYPDGTQDVRAPDGSCWRLAPSGAVVHAWQEPPAPQWRPPESVAAGQPDGGTVVYHPDGSKELWHGGAPVARFDPTGRPAG